jgi:hypothetical protein
MARRKGRTRSDMSRVGKVALFQHHGAWWCQYRENNKRHRRRLGLDRNEAEAVEAHSLHADLAGTDAVFADPARGDCGLKRNGPAEG